MIVSSPTYSTWTSSFKGVPDSEQVSISYRKPKAGQRADWTRVVARRKVDGSYETYSETDYRSIILQSDLKISGLYEDIDGRQVEIKTGEQLLASTATESYAIMRMIASEIMKLPVSEQKEKNLEKDSEPSSQA